MVNYELMYEKYKKYFDDGIVYEICHTDNYAILNLFDGAYLYVPFLKENYEYLGFQASRETCEVFAKANNNGVFGLWQKKLKKQIGKRFDDVVVYLGDHLYQYAANYKDKPAPVINKEWEEHMKQTYGQKRGR